ncbi:MAG: hypothetical protein RMK49_11135, partial [Abditibacteriales bacterium]|nr:hypothetical protein [Abditibacteriales bacterium]
MPHSVVPSENEAQIARRGFRDGVPGYFQSIVHAPLTHHVAGKCHGFAPLAMTGIFEGIVAVCKSSSFSSSVVCEGRERG